MSRRMLSIGGPGVVNYTSGGATVNVLPKGDGAYGLKDSSITDNGTTVSTAESIATSSVVTIGSTTADTTAGVSVVNANLTGTSQWGGYFGPTASSAATVACYGGYFAPATAASAFTCADVPGVFIDNPTKGAGSTITNAYGLQIGNITTGSTNYSIKTGSGQINFGDKITLYNNVATVGMGVPYCVAVSNLTTQAAAITPTTIYAVPASAGGMYRVSWGASVTRAATTSSTLGGAAGFQVVYTDSNDSVVKTTAAAGAPSAGANQGYSQTNQGNTTASAISGCIIAYAKASTNLQYSFGYTSSGATTMQYDLNIIVERMS